MPVENPWSHAVTRTVYKIHSAESAKSGTQMQTLERGNAGETGKANRARADVSRGRLTGGVIRELPCSGVIPLAGATPALPETF
jgi:hypothetical protein